MLVVAVMASFVGCGGGGLFANAYLVRGEEVTADEWIEAFDFSDFDNFSVYMTNESEDEDGAFQTETTYKFADGNVHVQAKVHVTRTKQRKPRNSRRIISARPSITGFVTCTLTTPRAASGNAIPK